MAATVLPIDLIMRSPITFDGLSIWKLFLGSAVAYILLRIYQARAINVDVPTMGVPPGLLGPWRAAYNWIGSGEKILRQGLALHGPTGQPFKVSTPARWITVLPSKELIEELGNAPESVLSFQEAADDRLSLMHTMNLSFAKNAYHLKVIKTNLTRRLGSVLPDVLEELVLAFEANTNIGAEWTKIDNWNVLLKCISRTTNRLFVGLPLCRNEEYLNQLVKFSVSVSTAGLAIDMLPRILKPFGAWYLVPRSATRKTLKNFVGPIFEERKKKARELGDKWTDKPNDAVQWVLDAAPPGETTSNMISRVLLLNFAAIQTTGLTTTQALYDLAGYVDIAYQDKLRDEIENALTSEGGWTKQALTKMKGLDSFLRESLRINGVAITTVMRKARQDYTFQNGLRIPKGGLVVAPASALHHSDTVYDNAETFDGSRFLRMREEPGGATKYQMVSAEPEYLPWGMGKSACPGRFFAANEIKLLMAYIICNYQVRIPGGGARPDNKFFSEACIPDFELGLEYRARPDRASSMTTAGVRKTG